jgi:quercetin dioxygenase-like cupin family protein
MDEFMKSIDLFENWKFDHTGAHADPLHVDRNSRTILFTLEPEQTIRAYNVPGSPFFVVVLAGQGVFTGSDGVEQVAGANTLLVIEPGEQHTIRALEELVFVGFLHGVPGTQK